jgi:hypothetical protein
VICWMNLMVVLGCFRLVTGVRAKRDALRDA